MLESEVSRRQPNAQLSLIYLSVCVCQLGKVAANQMSNEAFVVMLLCLSKGTLELYTTFSALCVDGHYAAKGNPK